MHNAQLAMHNVKYTMENYAKVKMHNAQCVIQKAKSKKQSAQSTMHYEQYKPKTLNYLGLGDCQAALSIALCTFSIALQLILY